MRIDGLDRRQAAFNGTPPCALTAGAIMIAVPEGLGSLAITSVAGQAVAAGGAAAIVHVAPAAPANQTVVVEARDYTGIVPIAVVLTPPNGARTVINTEIDMSSGNPAHVVVPVTLGLLGPIRVDAWTR